jgi:hypothetical protein
VQNQKGAMEKQGKARGKKRFLGVEEREGEGWGVGTGLSASFMILHSDKSSWLGVVRYPDSQSSWLTSFYGSPMDSLSLISKSGASLRESKGIHWPCLFIELEQTEASYNGGISHRDRPLTVSILNKI